MQEQQPDTEQTGYPSAFQIAGLPSRRVLIVDDNRDAVDMEARLLKMLGQVVERAYDGPTAIRIATDFKPEIVLMDLDMPGMSGFDVARHLSGCEWMEGARLIAYTAFGQPRYRSAAIAAGFDDFIMKPVALMKLIEILRGSRAAE